VNTAYDLTESAVLITKLVALTREGKVEWTEKNLRSLGSIEVTSRYQTTLDGDLNALVWLSSKSAGFRLVENVIEPNANAQSIPPIGPLSSAKLQTVPSLRMISERDLLAVHFDHEDGPARGEIYINLMSLLELARRSSDKIEPKVDRVKQYLDKLAV
jgi:hypothetical protein